MRGTYLLLVIASALTVACTDSPTGPPEAPRPAFITGNFAEDHVHTWVGLIVFYDENGEFSHRCSGSLISSTKFLTAGHCTEGINSARIWFAQDAGAHFDPVTEFDPVSGYPDTCLPQPAPCVTSHEMFNFGAFTAFPDIHDVGVVILDEPVTTVGFGQLAPAGTLDVLVNRRGQLDVTFVLSGYGVSAVKPFPLSFRERLMAESQLVNLTSALTGGFNLQTTNNPGNGRGGACFGDSGGPVLYQGEIVGVTSFGLNANCKGVDFAYRVDRAEVQTWIADPS
jgi:hypothetical protein